MSQPAAKCDHCGQPLQGICRFCGAFFCHRHGGPGMLLCRRHWLVTTVAGVGVTLLLIAGTLVAAFLNARP
ncbi:MAG TPA: hypothetical protein VD866_11380 [Urbifossiella sp.]|nr:hypothetical protein [Urbifossiella sp.]